jgi:hypothetical protein
MRASDPIAEALRRHSLARATPKATASTTLLTLRRERLVLKPAPAHPMDVIAQAEARAEEKPKRRSRRLRCDTKRATFNHYRRATRVRHV